jgi:hypothetical protein
MRTSETRPRHAVPRAAGAILVIALAATGCARTAGGGSPVTILDPPLGRGELILRMETSGGFAAPQTTLQQMPAFSLYGDGQMLTQGAQIEIYPGPALSNVIATSLTTDGMQALLRDALAAGLGANHSYTSMSVSDMPTTTFTLVTNGGTHTTSVYGLGAGGPTQGMGDAERRARAALERFSAELSDLRGALPAGSVGRDHPYSPEGLRVFVQPPEPAPDPALHQKSVTWPLPTPLARFGKATAGLPGTRCGAVAGSDLDRLLPLARSANPLTPWRSKGATFSLVFRVLLPDEEGC